MNGGPAKVNRIDERTGRRYPLSIGIPVLCATVSANGRAQFGIETGEEVAVGIVLDLPLRMQRRGHHQQLPLLLSKPFGQPSKR